MKRHAPAPRPPAQGKATGRGTADNPHNRFAPLAVQWDDGIEGPSPVTECRPLQARSIIARNHSPDVPFAQSINPYQGCEHGCIYCYARPTHAYLDLSPGLDFETRLGCKVNAAQLLVRELDRGAYRCAPLTLGANTDPYQPVEKEQRITRSVLEVLQRCDHPVTLITKGALVTRDSDILADMATRGLCSVAISITTLDDDLKRRLEPRAASAAARLAAMESLARAGVPVTLLFAPVIPGLNEQELESVVARAADAGAVDANYILLRLPLEVAGLFRQWLQQHYPLRAAHVMSVLRQSRGGADNDPRFGHRMRGSGPFADLIARRFELACRRSGLQQRHSTELRTDLFRPPSGSATQGELFD
ncbi:MAG: radical SAM protein [Halioglobus sp.]|nr:radical SAM protein [Halioglobus sp.]|tara:strand:+ start:411 stop:1496 length:1086 start_codon:yes stop_codon:yes gene_type:complete